MRHEDFLLLIDEHLDQTLSAEDEVRLTEHLAACDLCRAELDSCRRLRRLAITAAPVPIPDDLGHRIRVRLAERRPVGRGGSRWLRLSPMLSGLAAAAVLLLLVLPRPLAPPPSGELVPASTPIGKAPAVDRVLSDWLLLAENADPTEIALLRSEAEDLSLLPRVRACLADARGERRRWLRAGEDLLVQLENDAGGEFLVEEARLVAEVTR